MMRGALIHRTPTLDRMPAGYPATERSEPQRYEIRVRGPIGETVMQAFPTLTTSRSGQDTLLVGSLADQSALYGVIGQLEALGLQLLEIRRLPADEAGTTGASTVNHARATQPASTNPHSKEHTS